MTDIEPDLVFKTSLRTPEEDAEIDRRKKLWFYGTRIVTAPCILLLLVPLLILGTIHAVFVVVTLALVIALDHLDTWSQGWPSYRSLKEDLRSFWKSVPRQTLIHALGNFWSYPK